MFKKLLFFLTICLFFILGTLDPSIVFASATNGIIDSTYKYAWGENIGWINFGTSGGNIYVTSEGLTGYAWSENYGWINLHANELTGGSVTNDGEGNLGGNAWGEGLGWINFSGVTIDEDGYFLGYATIENDGSQISFNCSNTSSCGSSDFKVRTDWRATVPGTVSGSVLGSSYRGETPTPEEILESAPCSAELMITDNMKLGDRDGQYSDYNKGTVKQVALLQTHINRILAASHKEAAGPVDGIFGPLTEQGLKRLQIALNDIVKPVPLLVVDGVVGPFTKAAINNSCGFFGQVATTPPVVPVTVPALAPTPISSEESVDIKPSIPEEYQVPEKGITKPVPTINRINTFVNTYVVKPVTKAIIYTSLLIKTTLTNFWHGFTAPIINLLK